MEKQFVIQFGDIGHLEGLIRLATLFRDELERTKPSEEELRDSIRALLVDGGAEFFVALGDAGDCEGFIQQRYRYSMWVSGLEACIEDLYVVPASRGWGVASRLVEYAIARAQAKNCRSIALDTNELNEPAILLYTRLGFSCESSRFTGGKQLWFERPL